MLKLRPWNIGNSILLPADKGVFMRIVELDLELFQGT